MVSTCLTLIYKSSPWVQTKKQAHVRPTHYQLAHIALACPQRQLRKLSNGFLKSRCIMPRAFFSSSSLVAVSKKKINLVCHVAFTEIMLSPNVKFFLLQVFTDHLFCNLDWTFWGVYIRCHNFGHPQCLPFQKPKNPSICSFLVFFSYFLSRDFRHYSLHNFCSQQELRKMRAKQHLSPSVCYLWAINLIRQALDLFLCCSFYSKHSLLNLSIVLSVLSQSTLGFGTFFAQFYGSTT